MTNTFRMWHKFKANMRHDHSLIEYEIPIWKWNSMSFWGYHKKQLTRKKEHRAVRCHHRTMFSHGRHDNIINYNGFLYTY